MFFRVSFGTNNIMYFFYCVRRNRKRIATKRCSYSFLLAISASDFGAKVTVFPEGSEVSDWLIVFDPVLLARVKDRPKCQPFGPCRTGPNHIVVYWCHGF